MRPELLLTFGLLALTLGLSLYGKRQQQTEAYVGPVMLLVLYLALLWMPLAWRNGVMSLIIVLIGLSLGSFFGGLLFAGITYAIGILVPGGMSVLLLILSALLMLMWIHEGVTQLRRIARAKRLEPGKIPASEVGVGGVAEALRPIQAPLPELKCAAWWLSYGEHKHHSASPLLLRGDQLNAIVELSGAELGMTKNTGLDAKALQKFIADHQLTPFEGKPEEAATLKWIEEGQEAYVIGLPEWESRMESGDQYRESAMIPVFRARELHSVLLSNQSRDGVHRAARWDVALGLGMFVECALVIGTQLLVG